MIRIKNWGIWFDGWKPALPFIIVMTGNNQFRMSIYIYPFNCEYIKETKGIGRSNWSWQLFRKFEFYPELDGLGDNK